MKKLYLCQMDLSGNNIESKRELGLVTTIKEGKERILLHSSIFADRLSRDKFWEYRHVRSTNELRIKKDLNGLYVVQIADLTYKVFEITSIN